LTKEEIMRYILYQVLNTPFDIADTAPESNAVFLRP